MNAQNALYQSTTTDSICPHYTAGSEFSNAHFILTRLREFLPRLGKSEETVICKQQRQIKKRIQLEFKSKMGLILDKPNLGYGSTNDGNTARRFFFYTDLSSEITWADKRLIVKFSIIFNTVLASCISINIDRFRLLLEVTAPYLSLYSWYYTPRSVHKVLVYGCDIIDSFYLPIGQMSDNALEAHKDVTKNRLSHIHKRSRE